MKPLPAVLALVTDAFGGRGGIAQYNRDFLSALAETRTVSSIRVLPRHAPDLSVPPETIKQTLPRSDRISYSVAALRTALFEPVDIVFCGHLFMAPLAAMITRITSAKLIVQAHGVEVWQRPSLLQRMVLESADLVLCVSRHTRAAVLSWAGIVPERVLVVPNTVREVFTPGDGSSLRVALGLQGKRVLLTVGRMDSRERFKGHERVFAAISVLVAKHYDIYYLVVGEGDDRTRLEALARDLGVNHRVRFLGALDLQSLAEIYRMADLFVMPAIGEGFGIAFLEAMASGTPAIGLDVGGAKDALADGSLGMCVAEEQLNIAIERSLLAGKSDPHALASKVRARFGRKRFVAATHSALNRVMEPN
ncbi:MAG: glycosyltransferase family 4 protein [Acidobacteriota bacterium]|nr:glycosyltransferase family 4 protein [Acidobacteriota bacterium]